MSVVPPIRTIAPLLVVFFYLAVSPHGHAAPVSLSLFYTEGCHQCAEVKRLLDKIERMHAGKLTVKRLEITDLENYKQLMALERELGITQSSPMEVFIGRHCLSGYDRILRELEPTVADVLAQAISAPDARTLPTEAIRTQANNAPVPALGARSSVILSPLLIAGAGLADGINPCAFATIVFLVSLLAGRRFSPGVRLAAGLVFAFAVFLAYFLMGLGAFHFLHRLPYFPSFSNGLYWAVAVFACLLGALSVKDAWAYRRTGSPESLWLKLPTGIRGQIHDILRHVVRPPSSAAGSSSFAAGSRVGMVSLCFLAGLGISALEVVCTGQMYLPTLMVMTQQASTRMTGMGWLLLYNIMFILPLLGVLALCLAGLKVERLLGVSKAAVVWSKWVMAFIFFGLGTAMIVPRLR